MKAENTEIVAVKMAAYGHQYNEGILCIHKFTAFI